MSAELPAALKAALARELEGVSRTRLAERAKRTSDAYRAGRGSAAVIREPMDALAYALVRSPATYAACAAAFGEAARRAPGFAPKTVLDAGAGAGAASWAAAQAWPGIETLLWLDSNPAFLELGARLASGALPVPQTSRADLTGAGDWPDADLVVASYALAEIVADRLDATVGRLWAATGGLLALVEPGTPGGFARLRQARAGLIAAGAEVLAPCPHDGECPMAEPDWCHVSVRLSRSRDHRLAKSAEAPFEDEPFAYLIVARPGLGTPAAARVIGRPRSAKPGVELRLCTPAGLESRQVPRRDKPGYALARRLAWGDGLES